MIAAKSHSVWRDARSTYVLRKSLSRSFRTVHSTLFGEFSIFPGLHRPRSKSELPLHFGQLSSPRMLLLAGSSIMIIPGIFSGCETFLNFLDPKRDRQTECGIHQFKWSVEIKQWFRQVIVHPASFFMGFSRKMCGFLVVSVRISAQKPQNFRLRRFRPSFCLVA